MSEKYYDGAETISGLNIIDDYHFSITLLHPFSAFPDVLAGSYLPILPSDAHAANKDQWGISVAIGTGPMKLESFEPGVEVKLVTNEEYHGNVPAFDGITYTNMDNDTALLEWEAGNIDVSPISSEMVSLYRENYGENLLEVPLVGGEWLSFNMDIAPLDDVAVRQALCYATDRTKITSDYFNDSVTPATAILPPAIPGHDDNSVNYTFDIEKAKQILADAGYTDGVTVECSVVEGSGAQQIFQILQQDYAAAGITLDISLVDNATWAEHRSTGNCSIYILNWFADYMDPDMFLNGIYNSSMEDFFSTGFADEWFDEQLLVGRSLSADEKDEFYAKLDHYLCSEVYAACPLYYSTGFSLVSDRVEGIILKADNTRSFLGATIVG